MCFQIILKIFWSCLNSSELNSTSKHTLIVEKSDFDGNQNEAFIPEADYQNCEGVSLDMSDVIEIKDAGVYDDLFDTDMLAKQETVKSMMALKTGKFPLNYLDKKSRLEKLSEVFSHPDLFLDIATGTSKEERFLLVIKWYLSTLHVSFASESIKKPITPVLGEIFNCTYSSDTMNDSITNNDGDINARFNWVPATSSGLIYTSEQISRIDNLAAFYVEHQASGICISSNVTINTAISFMHLKVNVSGFNEISLIKFNEKYNFKMPSPTINLMNGNISVVDSCEMECTRTGYKAIIVFIKGDMVNVECTRDNGSQKFCTISGHWRSFMHISSEEDKSSFRVFLDVSRLTISRKKVKPRNEQNDNESRKLWQEYAQHINEGKEDAADRTKEEIKKKAESQKTGNWQPELFENVDGRWLFKHRLD